MWKTVMQYCSWIAGHRNENKSYFVGSCDQVLKSRFFSFQISTALTPTVTLQIMRSQMHIIKCVLWNRESKSVVSVLRRLLAELYR